jgi:hypothetical protein
MRTDRRFGLWQMRLQGLQGIRRKANQAVWKDGLPAWPCGLRASAWRCRLCASCWVPVNDTGIVSGDVISCNALEECCWVSSLDKKAWEEASWPVEAHLGLRVRSGVLTRPEGWLSAASYVHHLVAS